MMKRDPRVAFVLLSALAGGCGGTGNDAHAGSDGGTTRSDASLDDATSRDSGKASETGSTDATHAPDTAVEAGAVWVPSSADPIHYHWQLATKFVVPSDELSSDGYVVYDIDGEENSAETVAALHALGPNVKVVCYVDVGTLESYRSDASSFPASVVGNANGWPGEHWLDVRQQSILLPLMQTRFQKWCKDKGFDAVEPDNLDAWENNPGFPITEAENISYDLAIAAMGHTMTLSMGLKNLPENAPSLEPHFDWALDEQCYEYSECSYFKTSFIAKGKAVWDVEYNQAPNCGDADGAQMNAQRRDLDLVAPGAKGYVYSPCVADTAASW
jgi:hypothetical protein